MSQTTITLLFLVFAIVSFILEKIPLGLTASICALGLTLTGILDVSTTFSQTATLSSASACLLSARHFSRREWQTKSEDL